MKEKITLLLTSSIYKICAHIERLSDLKFYSAELGIPKFKYNWLKYTYFFKPIFIGYTEGKPDRWSEYGPEDNNYYKESYLRTLPFYKINDVDKTVTCKPSVYISLNDNKKNENFTFESNEELFDFIYEIKSISKEPFITIES